MDKFYVNLFGFEDYLERGFLKSKELAWQCVTHKSYNHGVDAYNEKLAHFGTDPPLVPWPLAQMDLLYGVGWLVGARGSD